MKRKKVFGWPWWQVSFHPNLNALFPRRRGVTRGGVIGSTFLMASKEREVGDAATTAQTCVGSIA